MLRIPRRVGALLLLVLLNLGVLVLFGSLIWYDNALNRGITYAPSPENQPISWTDNAPLVGVNTYNLHMEPDPAAITRTLTLVRDLGVRYVRMQMPWDDIEIHGWGDFEDRRNIETQGVISAWHKYDRIVATANNLGIELIVRLDRPPDWSREKAIKRPAFVEGLERDGNSTGPPDKFSDYSAFVSAVVDRYRGQVRFFQLWNEPNLKNEWNWQEPDPKAFVSLLRLGYTAAKTANPDSIILFPSLAPVDGLDKRAPMTELEYLDEVYRAGGKDLFDIMSAQAYGLGQPPDEHRYVWIRPFDNWVWTRPVDTRTDVSRIVLLREVMERHGDGDKAVWISEMGWNSAPDSIPEERRFIWGNPVSEELKGQYLIDQIERARCEWPWVGVMHVWVLRFGGYLQPNPADPTPYFALVERDWTTLPAYTQLQAYLDEPVVAGVGVHAWEHAAVESIPNGWRIRFCGTQATLVGGLDGSLERVTLDGTETTLVRDGTSTGEQTLTTPVLDLDMEDSQHPHTLEIIAPGVKPPTRFVVARTPPLRQFWGIAGVVLIGLALVCGAITMAPLFAVIDDMVLFLSKHVWRKKPRKGVG